MKAKITIECEDDKTGITLYTIIEHMLRDIFSDYYCENSINSRLTIPEQRKLLDAYDSCGEEYLIRYIETFCENIELERR